MTDTTIKNGVPDDDSIIEEHIDDALSTRYLAYALSTITQRALPDVRDGLKPVHRRILYAMRQLKLNPENAHKKCARIVGDVMGQYHPHGDASIYDALVKLSQSFSARYPLVDGQGNFGNIDGDSAAAMRYTEAKMTAAGVALLEGIDEDAVDFISTYNEEDEEPVVLPAGFPNLLANGSQGIAVGMATSIPPHNAAEICDAALHLIKSPNARIETLMNYVKGPDFPTGGIIIEPQESMLEAYKTADIIESKKVPWLEDVRDESAEDIRVVLEPKSKNIDPAALMESLFKVSDLESRSSINMNVLDATRTPRVMVIRIVRFEDKPKDELMKAFNLTERQADAILNMRLRALNKLQELELKTENDALAAEKAEIESLLGSEAKQWGVVAEQVKEIRDAYGPKTDIGKRRSTFSDAPDLEIDLATAFIVKEPVTVILSEKGWIRAMKGKVDDLSSVKFKDGDGPAFSVPCETTDKIILFATNGKFYTLGADKLPGGRGNGEPVRLMIDLEDDHEPIGMFVHDETRELLLASSDGYGFRVSEADIVASTRMSRGKGVRIQKFKDGGLADVATFKSEDGLSFVDSAGRTNSVADWKVLEGKRAGAGRMAPRGFSRGGRFAPDHRLK